MKIAYFDCCWGASGDMILAAFIDLGLSIKSLKQELSKLKIGKFDLSTKKVRRGHAWATQLEVITQANKRLPDLKSIFRVIDRSRLDKEIKEKAKTIFLNLARAEAKVHKEKLDKLCFHQIGELDTIIDIVGCLIALKMLKIECVYIDRLTIGAGSVEFENTKLPLPAPAALELLKKFKIEINSQIRYETVTPTAAAIIASLACQIDNSLSIKVEKIGYGAGAYNRPELPNVLRVLIADSVAPKVTDWVNVLETNIDDCLPLNFEILFERLFSAGALDVYSSSVMMKKNRPGILLSVQAQDEDLDKILKVIFSETTTLGIRINRVMRRKLERKTLNLKTDYGIIVRVKTAYLDGEIMNIAPEYEDCKKVSKKKKLPFKTVYERIKAQAVKKIGM
ncbi:MAG: nickel pincer cofactor biosynthesis protein LarC [Candidatus Omnitrophica bacterium]|nr:nickel pincer cofactor biosynthesis protein LarC [Candidatus Omnitrophota bacterium]MBU1925427.1 nickel pincer cofactor biosynthesis protein LarC [Candidatus Omnitrophota bacterium]